MAHKCFRLTADQRAHWLAPIHTAATIAALEAAFQACIHDPQDGHYLHLPQTLHHALRQAVERRGWELVTHDPQGALVPRIVQNPSSFRGTTYQGQAYPGGSWGNGPGYRWARQDLERWVHTVGAFASQALVGTIVDWVLFGMPHRALQVLHRSGDPPLAHTSVTEYTPPE